MSAWRDKRFEVGIVEGIYKTTLHKLPFSSWTRISTQVNDLKPTQAEIYTRQQLEGLHFLIGQLLGETK